MLRNIDTALEDALLWLTGHEAMPDYWPSKGCLTLYDLDDEMFSLDRLQSWVLEGPVVPYWSTGIGILEAAESLVREAVENGNFDLSEEEYKAWREAVSPSSAPRSRRYRSDSCVAGELLTVVCRDFLCEWPVPACVGRVPR